MYGTLDERGVGYGLCGRVGLGGAAGAGHYDLDDLGGPGVNAETLAIATPLMLFKPRR